MRVEVGRRAVENLGALVARAGLAMLDPGVAAGTLLVAAGGLPTISRPRFESGVVSLLPVEVLDSLSEEERSALGAALGAIYDAFDRSGADAADVTALAAGFTLLCAGRKSAKLLAAWEIVAEDATRGGWAYSGSDGASDGALTRRGLWCFYSGNQFLWGLAVNFLLAVSPGPCRPEQYFGPATSAHMSGLFLPLETSR